MGPYLRPVALQTKIADAQVEYKRVDLQSTLTQSLSTTLFSMVGIGWSDSFLLRF